MMHVYLLRSLINNVNLTGKRGSCRPHPLFQRRQSVSVSNLSFPEDFWLKMTRMSNGSPPKSSINGCEINSSEAAFDSLTNGIEDLLIQPKWSVPKVHIPSDAPLCKTCEQLDSSYFSIQCHSCREIVTNPETTISQLFAIMRQWVPQTQQCIELLVTEVLKRGGSVNDKDGLTDMTLLHYACKAGSSGVGDVKAALRTVHYLISNGADVSVRCRWTDMTALHYAVYFDVSEIVDYLLTISDRKHIDDPCRDFDGGTPLHIAATNLSLESVKVLLSHGANVLLKDDYGRTAYDCVPDVSLTNSILENSSEVASEIKTLLETATFACIPGENFTSQGFVTGKVVLQALGLTIGEKILISGSKTGTLRFCGATQFGSGIWAGVELDEPEGKHDGTFQGVTYFKCKPNHGVFAPISRVSKLDSCMWKNNRGTPCKNINYPGVDVSHVTPKVETGLSSLKAKQVVVPEISVGDTVILHDKRKGFVRFIGETQFASGTWYGIELTKPMGKNDGSVHGVYYFRCKPNYGLFAPSSRILKVIKSRDCEDNCSDSSITLSRSSSEFTKSLSSTKRGQPKPAFKTIVSSATNTSQSSPQSKSWLSIGTNVFVNSEIGVVRFIGEVDFADGVWLGVELRTANGKNDGSVQGKRYFSCKPKHGLLVRPKKVFVRGINGAKLLEGE